MLAELFFFKLGELREFAAFVFFMLFAVRLFPVRQMKGRQHVRHKIQFLWIIIKMETGLSASANEMGKRFDLLSVQDARVFKIK